LIFDVSRPGQSKIMFRRSKVEPLSGVQTKSSKTVPNPAQRIPSASGGASASGGSPATADCARSRTSLRCKSVGDEEYDSSIETDCGWAYVVLVVSFMIHFIIDGVTLSYGVFYVALSESFPDDTAFKLQMVGSVMMGLYMLVGKLNCHSQAHNNLLLCSYIRSSLNI
jgi:hypothetical protein